MLTNLMFYWSLTLAATPYNTYYLWDIDSAYYRQIVYKQVGFNANYDFEAKYKSFYVGGNMLCGMYKINTNESFIPMQMFYGLRMGFKFRNVNIYYKHDCKHPLAIQWAKLPARMEGALDEIGIVISNQ